MINVKTEDIVKIVQEYNNYIKNVCRKYYLIGGTIEDLYQEGIIGLLEACKNYNGESLFEPKFDCFVKICIKRQIFDAIRRTKNQKSKALNESVSLVSLSDSGDEMSKLDVPIVSIITGEGCSGGALGLAVADRVMMLEHAYYTVISPEGCASILWRDASMFAEAAEALKITSKDLLELDIIDTEIAEPIGGAHTDYETTAKNMKTAILDAFEELSKLSPEKLKEGRYNKFRKMGKFIEG